MSYSSYKFVPLQLDRVYRQALYLLHCQSQEVLPSQQHGDQSMAFPEKEYLMIGDYRYRPEKLEMFPLYFFIAGCTTSSHLNQDSMDWMALDEDGVVSHQRSYCSEPIKSKEYPEENLVNPEDVSEAVRSHGAFRAMALNLIIRCKKISYLLIRPSTF